jgi:hypothetical protein
VRPIQAMYAATGVRSNPPRCENAVLDDIRRRRMLFALRECRQNGIGRSTAGGRLGGKRQRVENGIRKPQSIRVVSGPNLNVRGRWDLSTNVSPGTRLQIK